MMMTVKLTTMMKETLYGFNIATKYTFTKL
jgi:hypothetical protein